MARKAIYVGKDAFYPQADREAAKALFARSVARVEIETHSYCNRRCEYCPNVVGDRLGDNARMPEEMYLRMMRDLAEIDYARHIVLQAYNEPLADRTIVRRIAQARAACRNAIIGIHTNADYLDAQYLAGLVEAGLSYMHISIHVKPGDAYSEAYALERMFEVCARIGLPAKLDSIKVGAVRPAPCHFVFSHFHVGYNGQIMPCCHLRSDRPEHAPYRIGHLGDFASIFQAYASPAATAWRRQLVGIRPKSKPCDTCTARFVGNSPALERLQKNLAARRDSLLAQAGSPQD
jgi:MoaA/NifB/PqqE/SkfB family radical SAM enzyme